MISPNLSDTMLDALIVFFCGEKEHQLGISICQLPVAFTENGAPQVFLYHRDSGVRSP